MTPRRTSGLIAACLFVISFILRWPSCGESLWLDELHTAWCTFGAFGEVSERASLGNQQPLYFGMLWVWQRLPPATLVDLYGIEAWLRLTSVLASATTASVVYAIVYRAMNSHLGGIAAGLAMAMESSSLFFGTELRPYAWVMLFSAVAIGAASVPMSRASRWCLHFVGVLAAATHLTSLLGLAPLIGLVMVVDWYAAAPKNQRASNWKQCHLGPIFVWCLFAVASVINHVDLWGVRERWNAFASPDTLWEVETLWPWLELLVYPGIAMALVGAYRIQMNRDSVLMPRHVRHWMFIVGGVVVMSTLGCYLLSTWGDVPLWSRRYLVSSLPMIGVMFGCLIGWIAQGGAANRFIAIGSMCFCLGVMSWQNGVLPKIYHGNPRQVVRGENWRAAIRYVNQHREVLSIESVWVDPALIEQDEQEVIVEDATRENYFRFVADGPYRFDDAIEVIGTGRNATEDWLKHGELSDDGKRTVLLTRRRVSRESFDSTTMKVRSFGSVKIIRLPIDDVK